MVISKEFTFENSKGEALDARLDMPEDENPTCYALFAHCFTCGKTSAAATRISREMATIGVGTMRFDFTGIGNSKGAFSNTTFSSNISDLVQAAAYMREHYKAPAFMIGHSLGGTATLAAAGLVKETKAVVTIGAPAHPAHVLHNFEDDVDDILAQGEKEVDLVGRKFTISSEFVKDTQQSIAERIETLRKALLILHAPLDNQVSVQEAKTIYDAAKHPKSFVSLENADHLLTNKNDASYVAKLVAAWASRYV